MTSEAKPELLVTVFSDYICPFCYVGDARLSHLRERYDLKVNWFFVEIHPETPPEGKPMTDIGYAPDVLDEKLANLAHMAEEEGLSIAEQKYTSNSHKALLLAQAVKENGRDIFYDLHARLFRAYFGEGRNIGDPEVLRELAREANVPDETVDHAWSDAIYEQRLKQNLAIAAKFDITSTPTYAIGNRFLNGAVSTDALREAAQEAVRKGLNTA